MPEEVKPHQLYKQVPGSLFTFSDTPGASTATGGWSVVQDPLSPVPYFVFRGYIDLAGWSKQELTTFTQGVDIQKQALPLLNGTAQGLNEHDIISTRALTDAEVQLFNNGPGFLPSTVDLMEVVYGQVTQLAVNGQVPGTFIKTNADTWGSGVPTATDKLHWTRIYYAHVPVANDTFLIHPTNLIIQAVSAKEKDLVWMERLRRSYVLQEAV
jgi:hypothetical protein